MGKEAKYVVRLYLGGCTWAASRVLTMRDAPLAVSDPSKNPAEFIGAEFPFQMTFRQYE